MTISVEFILMNIILAILSKKYLNIRIEKYIFLIIIDIIVIVVSFSELLDSLFFLVPFVTNIIGIVMGLIAIIKERRY